MATRNGPQRNVLLLFGVLSGISCTMMFRQGPVRPVLYAEDKTLAEIHWDNLGRMVHCRLLEMEEASDAEPLIHKSGLKTIYPGFKDMLTLINNCTRLERPHNSTIDLSIAELESHTWTSSSLWNGILPGTKWCGLGDIAGTFEDLGSQSQVDACCRAHDHCPVKLKAFRHGYGLINLSLYTKSHCECDRDFYLCLKTAETRMSEAVGQLYFNVMKLQCLREHRPMICIQNSTNTDNMHVCKQWGEDPNSKHMQVSANHLRF